MSSELVEKQTQSLVEKILYRDGKIMQGLFDSNDNLVRGEIDNTLWSIDTASDFGTPMLSIETATSIVKTMWFIRTPATTITCKCIKITNGYWHNGKLVKGKVTFANGAVWDGDWNTDGVFIKGKAIYGSSNVYEGDWNNDGEFIKGTIKLKNGNVYEGEFNNDGQFKNGKGKVTFANGNVYEGEFDNTYNLIRGKVTFANGDVCEGKFASGKLIKGKITYKDGYIINRDVNKYPIAIMKRCILRIVEYICTPPAHPTTPARSSFCQHNEHNEHNEHDKLL
jgi:hypothetical protein